MERGLGQFALWEAGRLLLGLVGAVLFAAAISALSASTGTYASTLVERLVAMFGGDFGPSVIGDVPAFGEVLRALPATLELLTLGLLIAFGVGIPVGMGLGSLRILRAAAPLIQIVAAVPVFCASLALVWFAVNILGWQDLGTTHRDLGAALVAGNSAVTLEALRATVLPAVTVGMAGASAVQLVLRRAASHAADQPYRRGLRLMGLSAFEIERLFVLPQMAAALLSGLGEITLAMLSAAAIAEWVFAWPGAAVLFVKSVALHDWNIVALVLMSFAWLTLIAQFLANLGTYMLTGTDPLP
ncbi:MAG: ABC transporter permease subunit [Alphaproteobacteria bacterium]|nr:ABC transporter permease subunit [Alphaproteobacteria bacterium]